MCDLPCVSGLWTLLSHNDPCRTDNCYLHSSEETESEALNHLGWAAQFMHRLFLVLTFSASLPCLPRSLGF